MSADQKIQRELEAGAQPHCELRSKKPRNVRILAAVVGVFLFAFGVTTGIALSQKLPISQALQAETIQNYLAKTFPDFFDKFGGQQSSATSETSEAPKVDEHESDKAVTGTTRPVSTTPKQQWQPALGLAWNYQLSLPPTPSQILNPSQFDVWGIDLFDTPISTIQTIQASGSRVVCYFSAGSYEPWRSDSSKFIASDKAKSMAGWSTEYWLITTSQNVRNIMKARLDLAQQKGCDGVDPDNMDAYNNDNGWNATQQNTIDYLTFLSAEAANRGLSIGLKNALEVVSDSTVGLVQYAVNEACSQYNECNMLMPFKNANKPVFNVEYPKGTTNNQAAVTGSKKNKSCVDPTSGGLSKIIKNRNLDAWVQAC